MVAPPDHRGGSRDGAAPIPLAAHVLSTHTLMAVVGIGTVLLVLMPVSVDEAIVRFMIMAGHGSRRVISHHAKGS